MGLFNSVGIIIITEEYNSILIITAADSTQTGHRRGSLDAKSLVYADPTSCGFLESFTFYACTNHAHNSKRFIILLISFRFKIRHSTSR